MSKSLVEDEEKNLSAGAEQEVRSAAEYGGSCRPSGKMRRRWRRRKRKPSARPGKTRKKICGNRPINQND